MRPGKEADHLGNETPVYLVIGPSITGEGYRISATPFNQAEKEQPVQVALEQDINVPFV
jgi:hypothetical protein